MLVNGRLQLEQIAVLKGSWTGEINLKPRLGMQRKKYLQSIKEHGKGINLCKRTHKREIVTTIRRPNINRSRWKSDCLIFWRQLTNWYQDGMVHAQYWHGKWLQTEYRCTKESKILHEGYEMTIGWYFTDNWSRTVQPFHPRATKGGGIHPLRFFWYHTFCTQNKILTFQVALGGSFAQI